MADDGSRTIARRAVIAAGVAGVAAVAAQATGAVLAPAGARAGDGDPMTVGNDNQGTGSTWVVAVGASPALGGRSDVGDGLMGSSGADAKSGVYGTGGHAKGYGIFGRNLVSHAMGYVGGPAAGVEGTSPDGKTKGRLGTANNGVSGEHVASGSLGILGNPEGGAIGTNTVLRTVGVLGGQTGVGGLHVDTGNEGRLGTKDHGVYGFTKDKETSGILGTTGTGVIGHNMKADTHGALGAAEAGVRAISAGTTVPALLVDGGVQLLRGGVAVVPKGKISVRVTRPKVSFPEAAVAVLQAYRPGVAVAASVVDKAAGSVTIYLTKKVTVDTPVAFFLFGTSGMT